MCFWNIAHSKQFLLFCHCGICFGFALSVNSRNWKMQQGFRTWYPWIKKNICLITKRWPLSIQTWHKWKKYEKIMLRRLDESIPVYFNDEYWWMGFPMTLAYQRSWGWSTGNMRFPSRIFCESIGFPAQNPCIEFWGKYTSIWANYQQLLHSNSPNLWQTQCHKLSLGP